MRFARLLWLVVFSAGCYSYTPVQAPRPGMEVRVRLTADAAARRSEGLDEPVLRYDGIVVDTTPGVLALDVLVARSSNAIQDVVIRDTVRLEPAELQWVLERRVSAWRTAAFTVGAAAGAVAVAKGIDRIVGGTGEEETEPEPQALRAPSPAAISIRVPLGWFGAIHRR